MRSPANPDAINRLRAARARVSQQLGPMKGALAMLRFDNLRPDMIAVATALIEEELEWIEELCIASRATEDEITRSAVLHVLSACGSPMLPCNCGASCVNLATLADTLDGLAPGVRTDWESLVWRARTGDGEAPTAPTV